ncbi:hypothetical protein [Novosphingobium sp. SG720]|uniref:hypothetical protein n=1 Tax=Novosphingobium sp. SG720 TaxID=2586998 RepID=UPI0014461FE0|nr:hypothetical protein [Novosphingobium sp. SG720]NKJ40796.1 hypothetical protein [Novosphingobium sp. SG720]
MIRPRTFHAELFVAALNTFALGLVVYWCATSNAPRATLSADIQALLAPVALLDLVFYGWLYFIREDAA